jgi:hypothetical protein
MTLLAHGHRGRSYGFEPVPTLRVQIRSKDWQLNQAVDSATAELRQSLQQEHDRAEALATELANARRA